MRRPPTWHRLVPWLAAAAIATVLSWHQPSDAQVPAAANRYRNELTRAAHSQWGLDAPVAALAAQVHQESAWRPGAVSPAGAQGLTQFMPATAAWWCQVNKLTPAQCQPTNPTWALRSMVGYDKWIHDRVRGTSACDRMAMALSGYNGGLGWVQRDQALASSKGLDPLRWWGHVELVNAGRTAANWRENREYPQRILKRWAPVYEAAGWGQGACP